MADSEFREYENGVADVLAAVVGEAGVVRRNVRLASGSGGRRRQIDVVVEGNIFGVTDGRLIADCKRWKKVIDKADVEAFIGLVEDVGADMGILVSAAGASDGAAGRARTARGVRIKPLSVAELNAWRSAGTVFKIVEINPADLERAAKALREAGLRVMVKESDSSLVRIEVFRHHGTANPSGEIQRAQHELTEATLAKHTIPYTSPGHGLIFSGGTPNHRWIDVRVAGNPFLKVLAADEVELGVEMERLAVQFGVPKELLAAERPEGWPFDRAFPF